jgi:hypothetical protein
MAARPTGSRAVLEDLARSVEEHTGKYGAPAHLRVLDLCAEAVSFAREGDPASVGTRARAASHLLLELVCPFLGAESLRALSLACERTAVQLR